MKANITLDQSRCIISYQIHVRSVEHRTREEFSLDYRTKTSPARKQSQKVQMEK
jgi:hypothetical protein